MYIVKNALKCISRAKGRNILIGVIVLVIAVSACLGLSIRQAAESAKEETLEGLSVTATISFDRMSAMGDFTPSGSKPSGESGNFGGFNRDDFEKMMGNASSLSIEEYQKYASASTVKDFYYTLSASFNGSESFLAVTNDSSSTTDTGGKFGGGKGQMMQTAQGDLTLTGYSGDNAMTDFISGTASITSGQVFDEGTANYDCIISSELATYNSLSVGDTVVITNPNNEDETYTLTVVGIYTSTESNEFSFSMGGTSSDPANQIYMSYTALKAITDASAASAETVTDEESGMEYSTEVSGTLSAIYSFASVDDYYTFESEVYDLGLDESYTVSSSDLTAYENSLVPLETLSKMACYFLIVILIIGAVILVVLNIFNIRERKYEIGVLTAMGMKKSKVALQFLCEIFAVTLVAVTVGIGAGAVSSVPVTNALLETQIESQSSQNDRLEQGFGRENSGMPSMPSGSETPTDIPSGGANKGGGGFSEFFGGAADYVTEIDSAMNLTVVFQMLGIALLLTLVSGAAGVLFVMRYEPLKILSNRD